MAELEVNGGPNPESEESRALRKLAAKIATGRPDNGDWQPLEELIEDWLDDSQYDRFVLLTPDGTPTSPTSHGDTSQTPDIRLDVADASGPVATLLLFSQTVSETPAAVDKETHFLTIHHQDDTVDMQSRAIGSGLRALLIALTLLVLAGVIGRLMRPLATLTATAERLGAGDFSARVADTGKDEIAKLAHTFDAMATRIENHEQRRRDLFNDVAHELRTPLTNLRARLEGLVDGVFEPTSGEFERLLADAVLLEHLTEDLQTLATAEAGELRLSIESLELHLEVAAAVKSSQAASPGVVFESQVAEQLLVQADPIRLRQILTNLLTNAGRFASGQPVVITAEQQENWIEISVVDKGAGISEPALAAIFDRFYRSESDRDRESGGSGLGLAIAKRLVTAHGGRIWADSVLGEGTAVRFEMPTQKKG